MSFYVTIDADGLDQLIQEFDNLDLSLHDVTPVANEIAVVMQAENLAARLAGVDRDGYPFQPLAESTLRRHPRTDDTPLIPMGMSSRVTGEFEIVVENVGPGSADVVGSWPSMDAFIQYHVTGTRFMPARDPAGLTPTAWGRVGDAFDAWLSEIAGVRLDG